MITLHSKVGERGQVVIPKPIRDMLKIQPNDELFFLVEENRIVIEQRTPEEIVEEYLSVVKEKKRLDGRIDWDREYASQFGG
ncbi:MAG: AbrB/MazE/SpoVT family DNA-binding domain-containing protein [Candidatus Thermoplasmatota archaeon]|nr:AbrB/MazE/SpoVT family DNA-binding domain-containing protein [Candidatus Thermoplasmatota archaeon]